MKSLKSDISEAYKVQVGCLKIQSLIFMIKMKEKANNLVRLYKAMQQKLKTASYSEQIQILTLVPNKWSRMYYSEYFNVSEYLAWTLHKIKKVGRTLAKPAFKKEKLSPLKHFIW